MTPAQLVLSGVAVFAIGIAVGYIVRRYLAQRAEHTVEKRVQQKLQEAEEKARTTVEEAKQEAQSLRDKAKEEEEEKRQELLKEEKMLLQRGAKLDEKSNELEDTRRELEQKRDRLRELKGEIEEQHEQAKQKLQDVAQLSEEEAKEELFNQVEQDKEQEILARIRKLEREGWQRYEQRAKDILASAIQKVSTSQAQELTTTTVSLPDDEIKGRIIGKEGRNIQTLERLAGVEITVDDTPEVVVISGFDPRRRQVAKLALQNLIIDGRIQPARIEEEVEKAEEEIDQQIQKAGETAAYDTNVMGLDPQLIKLLGRLKFRTSYGQNVLLHSIEVAHLAGALASEIGGDPKVAKKAGLLHDIGKAVDHEVEGSHVDIGMRILEKFNAGQEVIDAMKSHHEEYEHESLEAVLVTVADAISGARPGARKDTLENYLKRIEDLERTAENFDGVEKVWALQAGREIRVFVHPEEITDMQAQQLARDIATEIENELKYPGEIKVNLIREKRVTEYAK